MEPEGTSRDDLDVRLHWPGAEPETAAELTRAEPSNGASVEGRASEHRRAAPPQPEPPKPEWDSEDLRAALAIISARLDALVDMTISLRGPLDEMPGEAALIGAIERLEHLVAKASRGDDRGDEIVRQLTEIAERQLGAASRERTDELLVHVKELSHQVEALRRRLTLRARADSSLSPDAIESIAEAVAERLSPRAASPSKGRRFRSGEGTGRK